MNIPQIGDNVYIESEEYTGEATVTFINQSDLYNHHMFPIQVEIDEGDLHKIHGFNDGQQMYRTNLKEISGTQSAKKEIVGDEQYSLFDDFS